MSKTKTNFQLKALPYEKLTALIYSQLSPGFTVTHDDKIIGHISKRSRQIDVSIKGSIGPHEFLMIVQCKNQKRKVDTTQFGSFVEMIKDVKANKGIIVSNSGFSKSVVNQAKFYGVELCSIHEALNKNWSQELKIPIIWDVLEAEVQLTGSICFGRTKPQLGSKDFIFDLDKNEIIQKFNEQWNNGVLNEHTTKFTLFKHELDDPKWEIMGNLCSIKEQALNYKVVHKYYLGCLEELPSVRGIKNELTGKFEFSMNLNDFRDFDKTKMLQIKDPEKIALDIKSVIKVKLEPKQVQQLR